MKTDVRETDNAYEPDIDLPGFKKDEIKLNLQDGYMTITASKGMDKEEKNKKGRYSTIFNAPSDIPLCMMYISIPFRGMIYMQ